MNTRLGRAIFSLAVLFGTVLSGTMAFGQVSGWQVKGINIALPGSSTDYQGSACQQSMQQAIADHANTITLAVPIRQSNVSSTDVSTGGTTPTDAALAAGINYIHNQGAKVMLKIHDFPDDGQWSAHINPSDRTTWFANYSALLNHFADIAQANRVEWIVIGNELADMSMASVNSTNTQNWINLISAVRQHFSGFLSYDANWGGPDEKNGINFWPNLDAVGISGYFNLNGSNPGATVSDIEGYWGSIYNNDLLPLHNRTGKPILFSEIGYRSMNDDHDRPWMWWNDGTTGLNIGEQQSDYTALFGFWNTVSSSIMDGIVIWNYKCGSGSGGTGDNDYTPQNKPAETVIANFFGQGAGAPPPPPPPPPSGSFSASASFTPNAPVVGQTVNFSATVTDNNGSLSNVLVDYEISNSSGTQVYQHTPFFTNVNLSQGVPASFNFSWTPSAADTYTLKMGIFSNDWSTQYTWNNQVATIKVSSGTPQPPGPGTAVDIWWPQPGPNCCSGVQPFKAVIDGVDISTYKMFWQVNGDVLNPMPAVTASPAHYESDVDLSGWTFTGPGGTGPYVVNFVAKDLNGNVIGQKSVTINVAH